MSDTPAPALPRGALRLDDWGLIRAAGADARRFLHGQLTQDVEGLQPGQARLGGWCSAKGRLLASFVFWADGPEDVLLACSADLLPAALKRLSMFVLRLKCKLSDASGEIPLWGLAGADTALPPWGVADGRLRLPDGWADGAAVTRQLCIGAEPAGQPALDAGAWRWLEASSGVPRIVAATVERFVPQMVNLEQVGGVNFKKGCYPGQEVVARSQYRGTLKRRGALLEADAPLEPGQELFHSADPEQPAGLVALAGSWNGRHAGFVEIKLAALEGGGTLHAGGAGGPLLRPLALPYAIEAEAA